MIGKIKEKIKKQVSAIPARQRMLLALLGAVILSSLYYNLFYKRQSQGMLSARQELARIGNESRKLEAGFPDIKKAQGELDVLKAKLEKSKSELSELEGTLPTQGNVPQILGELVHQASGYAIDFSSIKQKGYREAGGYAQLDIEMKLNSDYADFVNYLNRVQSLSTFLKVTDIAIEEMKENFKGGLNITLLFTTLIGPGAPQAAKREEKPEGFVPPVQVERNPFVSKFAPQKVAEIKEELHLTGIIANSPQPTAIINNEVYKVGDAIGEKVIKKILPNMVILTYGEESIALTLKQ